MGHEPILYQNKTINQTGMKALNKGQISMQRRNFLKIATTTVGALTKTAAWSSAPINYFSHKRRNVLFIAVDDLKPLIGAFGSSEVHTPHMDRLAKVA